MSSEINSHQTVHLLIELRARLIYSLIVLFSLLAIFLYFSNQLYTWLALPLLKFLPHGHLIATQMVSPFFVPFKLAFMAAMLLAAPFFLYQLWRFISPALYVDERRLIWPFLLMSIFLFYAGISFAYFIIFPALFDFLAHVVPDGVVLSPDISEYLNFTINLMLIFGSLFEIPIVIVVLVATHWVSRDRLIQLRPYAIIGAFVIAMFISPPDVLSQTLLAIPIWLLYESGIVMTHFLSKKAIIHDDK